MNKELKNWLAMVEYDLAIEKILKAIVSAETGKIPPKTHDLIYLLSLGKTPLPEGLSDFIGMINNVSIVTRYPEDLSKLISSYPRAITKKYLDQTKETIQCLKQDKRLRKL